MDVASWVVIENATGRAILETFNPKTATAINTAKYTAVPILEYLVSINGHWRPKAMKLNLREVNAELLVALKTIKGYFADLENGTRGDDPLKAVRAMAHQKFHRVLDAAINLGEEA